MQCKFFASGACKRGDECTFTHSFQAPANTVCKFYLNGSCTYGDRCRYDHIRPSTSSSGVLRKVGHQHPSGSRERMAPPPPPPSARNSQASGQTPAWRSRGPPATRSKPGTVATPANKPKEEAGWGHRARDISDDDLLNKPLCSMAMQGHCPRGDTCHYLHGDVCAICGLECLHPFNVAKRDEHEAECAKARAAKLQLEMSMEVDCGICYERVLGNERKSERRFGILPSCAHSFCLSCIRNWRDGSRASSEGQMVRTCPICRAVSYYVVPSAIWVQSSEDKEKLLQEYRGKTAEIPCRHFDHGRGVCPFGGSCFYAHRLEDGTLVPAARPRYVEGGDETSVIQRNNTLSEFLTAAPEAYSRR
mmetsp:Transcript_18055/g.34473  ORF Transcript_18055/g.34473 Transcript_18055/m.34473 type:complete len:362 (-) Transcript_18055:278-1363(-)